MWSCLLMIGEVRAFLEQMLPTDYYIHCHPSAARRRAGKFDSAAYISIKYSKLSFKTYSSGDGMFKATNSPFGINGESQAEQLVPMDAATLPRPNLLSPDTGVHETRAELLVHSLVGSPVVNNVVAQES